jgi:F-type H+-transporting ATPase subunit epsilon
VATSLNVDIVTPQLAAWSGEAQQVILPAFEGQLGVLPDHDMLLALVVPGIATLFTASGPQRFVFDSGFAEIGPERVTVLTESCIPVDQVDKAAAKADLAAAEADLESLNRESDAAKVLLRRVAYSKALLEA